MIRRLRFGPFLLFAVCSSAGWGQDTLDYRSRTPSVELGLSAGYHKEIGRPDEAPLHMAEIGLVKGTRDTRHPNSMSAWGSVAFGMRHRPILMPRVGAQIGIMAVSVGLEIAYLTDFEQGSLVFVPSIGFGGYPLRLAVEPHARLVNTEFRPIDGGSFSITYRIITLRRRIVGQPVY